MSLDRRRAIWLLIATGTAGRLVLAFTTVPIPFDVDSERMVVSALGHQPLHVYGIVNAHSQLGEFRLYRWPYPPGFFPWLVVARGLNELGLSFAGCVKLAPIAADAAMAWLVQDMLGRRGYGDRARIAGSALVALGPGFLLISGHQGQIDSVAILPALLALRLWTTDGGPRRALWAGLLLGVGASVKTVPLLMILALLPSSRSRREALTLVLAAIAVPLAVLSPFLVADFHSVSHSLRYAGGPGLGGVTILVDPGISTSFVTGTVKGLNPVGDALYHHAALALGAALALLCLFLARFRPPAPQAAVLLWLTVYFFYPNFAIQYIVWGLPFFVLSGRFWQVALYQAALLPAALILYLRPWEQQAVGVLYVAIMAAIWLAWGWALLAFARGVASGAALSPPARPAEA